LKIGVVLKLKRKNMQSQTEEIKSKLDIIDVIGEYVQLRQSGANFKGLCPFHNEKTPSFMVSREKQFFKCFGCSESGDIFSFLQKIENIEFPEALRLLGEKAGVEIVKQDPQISSLKSKLLDIHDVITEFYQAQLKDPQNKVALSYLLEKRKLSMETIENFKLGYSPDSWDSTSKFLKQKGYSDHEIKMSGLVVEKNAGYGFYDRFRDRIMFPIENSFGKVVGFTSRTMKKDEGAKYVNTPQTMLYNKSEIMFGLAKAKEQIKEKDLIILVEGNMDVIVSNQADVKNVVAVSGTALTEEQVGIIKRFTKNVALCLDSDEAGKRAKKRSIEMLLENDINIKIIWLSENAKDPDELIQKDVLLWQDAVSKSSDWMENLFLEEVGDVAVNDLDQKRKIAQNILPWIAKIFDPLVRDHYLKKLSDVISIDEQVLRDSLVKYGDDYKKKMLLKKKNASKDEQNGQIVEKQDKQGRLEERFLAFLLSDIRLLNLEIEKKEEKGLLSDRLDFYKKIILFYNEREDFKKEQFIEFLKREGSGSLVSLFNSLEIYAEEEFVEMTEKEKEIEFVKIQNDLHQNHLFQKRQVLNQKLRQAEQQKDSELANKILLEISSLK
jgi:DNA primase